MPSLRISVCLNAGQQKGQPQAALLLAPAATTEALLQLAANKLRLKKKEQQRAQLYIWKNGTELLRGASVEHFLQNDDLVAISLGEPYAGPCSASGPTSSHESAHEPVLLPSLAPIAAPLIHGQDDAGRTFASLGELWMEQASCHADYYLANDAWWDADGYGGAGDEEAMIGDSGSVEDVTHSQALLDAVRASRPQLQLNHALDCGAGIGRVTKHVLLRRCERVTLLEPCSRWHKQARRYLGNKRAQRCSFVCERLEGFQPPRTSFDLIWVQWCLQYLVDAHVVQALQHLSAALTPHGVLVLKENRPMHNRDDEFTVDVPEGAHGRYDITRPDAHHRWLFRCAGLIELSSEHHDEVTAWVLCQAPSPVRSNSTLGQGVAVSGDVEGPSLSPPPSLPSQTGNAGVLVAEAMAMVNVEDIERTNPLS